MLTVSFKTLGCKLNQTETAMMMQDFKDHGYQVLDWGNFTDVTVLNTCTVTGRSDSKCRQAIRQVLRVDPDTTVIVAGCYAQVSAEDIRQLEGVDYILGVQEKLDIFKVFTGPGKLKSPVVSVSPVSGRKEIIPHDVGDFRKQTRAILRIQSGCNNRCAYCIVPVARGPSRSMPVDEVVRQTEKLVRDGFKEVVLTGVHVGEYGGEWANGSKLSDLIDRLVKISGLHRIRLTSLEPENVTDTLLDVIDAYPKVCRHFHLSIQSGSETILKSMKRRSSAAQIYEVIGKLIRRFPNSGLGADIIVGFPGETEEHFNETVTLIKNSPFTYLHVFPFSARKDTLAATLPNQLPERIRMERAKVLRLLGEEKKRIFQSLWIGRTADVLFENRNLYGCMGGFTSEYLRVEMPFDPAYIHRIRKVHIEGLGENGVKGCIRDNS